MTSKQNRFSLRRLALAMLLVVAGLVSVSRAQLPTATVLGVVRDASGAVSGVQTTRGAIRPSCSQLRPFSGSSATFCMSTICPPEVVSVSFHYGKTPLRESIG